MRTTVAVDIVDQFGATIGRGIPMRIDIADTLSFRTADGIYELDVESAAFTGVKVRAVIDYPPPRPRRRGLISRLFR